MGERFDLWEVERSSENVSKLGLNLFQVQGTWAGNLQQCFCTQQMEVRTL